VRIFPMIAVLAVVATPAAAHDFWIQPLRWQVLPATALPVTVEVGHGSFRENWGGKAERLTMLQDISLNGKVDLRPIFRQGGQIPHLMWQSQHSGLHILSLVTSDAVSVLPAIRFNDYLKVEGLTPAIVERARTGKTDAPGRERYSRRAKTLIQVGPPDARSSLLATRTIGLSLEIVPERDPYALPADRRLPVRVMFEGKPLAGAYVKLTNLEFDARPLEAARTDRDGRVTFQIPRVGSWLVNVIWTKAITAPDADFETTFSSLTFGYPAAGARKK
jgi:uncharacterized GH25 family protein